MQVLENTERELLTMSEQTTRRLERVKRQCIVLEERVLVGAKLGSAISSRAAKAFTVQAQEPSSFQKCGGTHAKYLSRRPLSLGCTLQGKAPVAI